MPELSKIVSGKVAINLHTVRGQVAGASKWTTTQISGGGSSGYVHQGTGHTSTAPVTSTTTEHDQFFVRSPDGRETTVRLTGVQLALRDGHDVSLLWGIRDGNQRGPYLAVINHTTGDVTQIKSALLELGVTMGPLKFLLLCGVVLVGAIMALSLFFGSGPFFGRLVTAAIGGAAAWYAFQYLRTRNRLVKEVIGQVNSAAAQLTGRAG